MKTLRVVYNRQTTNWELRTRGKESELLQSDYCEYYLLRIAVDHALEDAKASGVNLPVPVKSIKGYYLQYPSGYRTIILDCNPNRFLQFYLDVINNFS